MHVFNNISMRQCIRNGLTLFQTITESVWSHAHTYFLDFYYGCYSLAIWFLSLAALTSNAILCVGPCPVMICACLLDPFHVFNKISFETYRIARNLEGKILAIDVLTNLILVPSAWFTYYMYCNRKGAFYFSEWLTIFRCSA